MTNELEPLPNDLLRALDAERGRPPASGDQVARLAARLEATFALPPAPLPPPPGTGVAAASAAAKGGLAGKALLVAVGMTVGGVTGAQLQARYGTPREVIVERRVNVPVEVRVPIVVEPEEQPAPEPERARPAPVPLRAPIEVERLLIEQATVALVRGNTAEALHACAQHLSQFRDGQLSEERESLAIRALLRLGRRDEAQTRAAAFRGRYPESLLLDMVDAALEHDQKNPDP
jgi:hypothetical protein